MVYDSNVEGEKLRLRDEDQKIRRMVRAYNMDHSGNSPYNPLNGQTRTSISQIVPAELNQRYEEKLREFKEGRRLKIPQTSF